jgi:hypothetical protein
MKIGNFTNAHYMMRIAKFVLGTVIALVACERASAFSIQGIPYTWQTTDMNYGSVIEPRNLGDEYRINTPIVTYGFDASFLDYFGLEGVKAVDEAFRVYNRLPAVSKMTTNLTEFMTAGNVLVNHRASALNLIDVKSTTMSAIAGYLGLSGQRHVFDLRARIATPVTCVYDYHTMIRNFDPITWNPTEYVNGVPYTYHIEDSCVVGDAVEEVKGVFTEAPALASDTLYLLGTYYLGLTRDDAGGLRYLYRKSNYNNEILPADALVVGNASQPWSNVSVTNPITGGDPSSPWNTAVVSSNTTTVYSSSRSAIFGAAAIASTNSVAIRGGIEKVTFVKMYYNSLFGTNFNPVTLSYSIPTVSSNKLTYQRIKRVVTVPDILITASDMDSILYVQVWTYIGAAATGSATTDYTPGVFDPRAAIVFNKTGQIYDNLGGANNGFFLSGVGGLREANSTLMSAWGVFDGSTNDPIVFPSGSSIREIERKIYTDPGQPTTISH